MAGAHGDAVMLEKKQDVGAFTPAEKMRFTSLTYKIIEELKMRREIDSENEKKIQKLLQERFTLGWKLDQENKKLASSGEKHDAELRDVRRQLQEKMKEYQVEASQHQVYRQLAEKEQEAMKEEIRKLQLANYALDKKVREYERQEKLHDTEREQHIEQVSKYETLFRQVQSLGSKVECRQEEIEAKMKYLQELTTKLQYETKHQTCILRMKDEDLEHLRKQLLESQVKVKLGPVFSDGERRGLQEQITQLQTRITALDKHNERLEKEGDDWKQKYWASLKTLDEAHRLVNVHLHNAAAFRDECRAVEEERNGLQLELKQNKDKLEELEKNMNETRIRFEEEKNDWEKHEETLKDTIAEVKGKLSDVAKEKVGIETKLNKLENDLVSAKQELDAAQAILGVDKLSCEVQTQLSLLAVTSRAVQAMPSECEKSVQATVSSRTGVSQTIDAALTSSCVQTDELEKDMAEMISVSCQTYTPADEVVVESNKSVIETKGDVLEKEEAMITTCVQTDICCMKTIHCSCAGTGALDFGETVSVKCMQNSRNHSPRETDHNKDAFVDGNIVGETLAEKNLENNETTNTVTKPAEAIFNIQNYNNTLKANNVQNAFKNNETVNNMSGAKDSQKSNAFKNCDAANKVFEKEMTDRENYQIDNIKEIGLSIPKIDLKTVKDIETVFVEPDEFSIELTQDDAVIEIDEEESIKVNKAKDVGELDGNNTAYVKYKPPAGNNINFVDISGESSQEDDEVAEILGDEEDLEAALEQKWALATDSSKRFSKGGKHKLLSAQDVKQKFLEFEDRKKTFEALMQVSNREEEVPYKLQKVEKPSVEESNEPLGDQIHVAECNVGLASASIAVSDEQKEGDEASLADAFVAPDSVNTSSEKTGTSRSVCETATSTGNPTAVKSAPSFLQTYRNLMAKIHPLPVHTAQSKRKADESDTGSDTKRTHASSPKPAAAKGILKGASGSKNKAKAITWSETVMMKDFYKHENE